jgi:hypothetical protein
VRTHLLPGLRPNQRQRCLWVAGPLVAALFFPAGFVFGVGFVVCTSFQFACVLGAAIWGFRKYRNILILQDGLEIDGRVVPFSTIEGVELRLTNQAVVNYRYHGVKMSTYVGVDMFAKTDLPAMMDELRLMAGLPQGLPGKVATAANA